MKRHRFKMTQLSDFDQMGWSCCETKDAFNRRYRSLAYL